MLEASIAIQEQMNFKTGIRNIKLVKSNILRIALELTPINCFYPCPVSENWSTEPGLQ